MVFKNKSSRVIIITCLAGIILLGGFLRLYGLAKSPPSVNWDEASLGYNAYAVLNTGKDEYSTRLPLFIRSFDDYKSAIPMYLMMPSIKAFGLNATSVRLPAALLGTLTILLVYLLSLKTLQNQIIALLGALVFAVEPWSIHYARTLEEATIALFFLLAGLLCFLSSKKYGYLLPLACLLLFIAQLTYHADKVVVPLLAIALFAMYRQDIKKNKQSIRLLSAGIVLICLIVLLWFTANGQMFARAGSTSILNLVTKTNFASYLSHEHPINFLVRVLLHNPIFYAAWDIIGRYFAYFSPANLFLREPQEPVTILAGNSVFHPYEFIFWVIGLWYLLKHFRKQKVLLILLLITPIPAAATWNWFQPARAMTLFTVYSILIGVGLFMVFTKATSFIRSLLLKRWTIVLIISIFITFILMNAVYVFDSMMVYLPKRDSGNWQYGFANVAPIVYQLSKQYNNVVIDTAQAQPYIFYLFYSQYPPSQYQRELDLQKIGTPRKSYDFGKFVFRKINWQQDKYLKKTLLVGSSNDLRDTDITSTPGARVITVVRGSRGDEEAKIVATE